MFYLVRSAAALTQVDLINNKSAAIQNIGPDLGLFRLLNRIPAPQI